MIASPPGGLDHPGTLADLPALDGDPSDEDVAVIPDIAVVATRVGVSRRAVRAGPPTR